MIINEEDLSIIKWDLNQAYLNSYKIFSIPKVIISPTIEVLNSSSIKVNLDIQISFTSKQDRVLIIETEFKNSINIKTYPVDKDNDAMYFRHAFLRVVESSKNYLLENLPPEIVEITPPLIQESEIEKLANDTFDLIAERVYRF